MRLRFVVVSCLVILGGPLPGLAQQPSGPRTLENLLESEDAEKLAAAAAEAGSTDAGPKRPAGTMARPKNGVAHPDLDKAWAQYEAAVAKASESLKAAISRQFDAATAKGDLDSAEKWQIALEKFEKTGEVPTEKEAKTALSAAVSDYKTASEELTKAYEAVVKSLTMEKKIEEAKAVRAEWLDVGKASGMTTRAEAQVLEPLGRWVEPADDLIRVVGPSGQYIEINRRLGRNQTTGLWRTIKPNLYETQTENGWTIRFRMLDRDRIEFRNTGPDGKVYPPYIRKKE